MTNYLASEEDLTTVANAIRTRGGTSGDLVFPNGFATAIANIPGGGGGDTVFVVTVSYNQQDDMWVPDCTYAQVSAAYTAGKAITVQTDSDEGVADGGWLAEGNNHLLYSVYDWHWNESLGLTGSRGRLYILSSSGVDVDEEWFDYEPNGTLNVTQSGTLDVAKYASASIAAGSATASATKGTVSNHSVSVTPSVTRTAGWVTAGSANGTAVTVSASELVSGTYTVSSSGTHDVTNYASASVASGSATASASKGAVSNHSIAVTPSVTRTAGYVTAGSANGTAVTVTASELVSGSQTVTTNNTYDVTNLAEMVVNVSGGGGGGMNVATSTATPSTASRSISFTGLSGEPTSFHIVCRGDLATASQVKVAAAAYDGTDHIGQTVTNTSNAQASYDDGFSHTYNNGTLTVTATTAYFQAEQYSLVYTYGGNSSNIGTADVQVGSGATSITFTGLTEEPSCWSCIFKSNFGTSSGYTRTIAVVNDGSSIYGMEMGSGAQATSHWTASYSNGSLTISSQSTSAGGYFHQPGYYQLTYGIGGTVEVTIEPLNVTQNGTYQESGKAYSPVTVNVSGGGSGLTKIATKSLGTISTTSTNAADTGQTLAITGFDAYDLLICIAHTSPHTNGRHVATVRLLSFAATSNVDTKTSAVVATSTQHYKLSSSGTLSERTGTTPYGVYVNSGSISTSGTRTLTLTIYQRYNSTSTGTINGSYTLDVYGVKLQDLL